MYICLFLAIILLIIGAALSINAFRDGFFEGVEISLGCFILFGLVAAILAAPFIVLDKSSGVTIGKITSVDKNFWGTTAIYIKTSETEQEKYCAESENVINKAKEYIGKDVKITYGTRVGFYHLDECHSAPIDTIELLNEERYNETKEG